LVIWQRAVQAGAAAQRNQGVALTTQPFIWFFDDDIVFEPDCVQNLWHAIESDEMLGGVNAMITNQRYSKPGKVSRTLFRLLHGKSEASYAGKCIGPALNLLPEDDSVLPEVVPVEWLNTTCTIYRKSALRIPPFSEHFTGYSLLEDLALSLTIGRNWKLANARTARIFHDSQPGVHKDNPTRIAEMALVNRHYVMNHVLHRNSLTDHVKLGLLEAFGVVTSLVAPGSWKTLPFVLIGKARGFWSILTQRQALSDDLAPRPSEAVALKSE
jgi:GT2 family glycosyltransferase